MVRTNLALPIALCGAAVLLLSLSAQSPQKTTPPPVDPDRPVYPRTNLSVSYEVDPNWPQKPDHVEWGQMPGVAVDASDNVWIYTRAKPPVQVYSPEGKLIRAWGDEVIGKAHHIKIDRDGFIWLTDIGLHVVRKFTREGQLLLTVGTPGEKGADGSHLYMPTDVAFGPNGDLFVSDGYGNNRVVHFDRNGRFIKQWGKLGTGKLDFSLPHAIAIDSKGRLYVADRNNARIQVYNQEGALLDTWQNIVVPWGFWVSPEDDIWVGGSSPMTWSIHPDYPTAPLGCPPKDQVFMRFDGGGRLLQLWTLPKAADGEEKPGTLNWLHAIALDSKGNIYAGDIIGRRVQKFARRL